MLKKISFKYQPKTSLSNGSQVVTLTIENVPEELASEDVTLTISGYQTAEDFFFFDATGGRTESQAMVGYNNSRLPVYAEVVAADERTLSIYKSATVEVGNSPMRQPLNMRHGNNSFYINRFTSYACFLYFSHYKKTNINRSITKSVAEN